MATLSGSMRLMGRMRPSSLKFLCCLLLPASLSLADPGNILLLGGGNDAATSLEPIFPNSNNPHDFTVEGWIYPQRVPSIIFSDDAYSAEIVQNLFSTNSADLGIQFTITHESSDGNLCIWELAVI
jgi:hypothetical protein